MYLTQRRTGIRYRGLSALYSPRGDRERFKRWCFLASGVCESRTVNITSSFNAATPRYEHTALYTYSQELNSQKPSKDK
ncbi:hypothetical protein E2C01_058588 [Portunus trituberculatus]|uniref:Uncharacterized protein n=1 Tax=Portunus trituberculatus TaxID=210409 RepID=A0A5B7GVZ1_PORTR|nr:hypothetical protein [Portunus trituberculatus]